MRRKRREKCNRINLRNSTRAFLVLLSIILLAFSSANFYNALFSKEFTTIQNDIYTYNNNFKSDYSINVKENPFIEQSTLPSGETYVSDLINSIDMNIHYDYSDSQTLPIFYSYKIDAIIDAKYSDDGNQYSIWNKTYNLKSFEQTETNSNELTIDENLNIDYAKYHQEVQNFKQSLGMNVNTFLYIKLTVNTLATLDDKNIENEYTSNFSITLGDKIAIVDSKDNETKSDSVKQEHTNLIDNTNVSKVFISALTMFVSIYMIYFISCKTKKLHSIKNNFKLELNRIIKSCQDRIVIVENQVKTDAETTITVKDFGELIKLSEELYKPILCWISDNFDKNEAHFSVISNKVKYLFILKD